MATVKKRTAQVSDKMADALANELADKPYTDQAKSAPESATTAPESAAAQEMTRAPTNFTMDVYEALQEAGKANKKIDDCKLTDPSKIIRHMVSLFLSDADLQNPIHVSDNPTKETRFRTSISMPLDDYDDIQMMTMKNKRNKNHKLKNFAAVTRYLADLYLANPDKYNKPES